MVNKHKATMNQGELRFPGMETGKLKVIEENHEFIVVRESGHTYWSGRGMRAYAPANTTVYRKLEEFTRTKADNMTKYRTMVLEPIISWEGRK